MSQDAKWMVRSGGRISGPYSKRQIPELLKSREVHLRDEVSEPFSRWITLEFHSQFADEVDAFKREIHSEKTEVSLTPAETTGFGITQTTTDLADSELTQEITHDLSGFTNTKEIVIDDVQDTPGAQKRNLEAAQYQLKGLDSSPYVSGESQKASTYIQAFVIVLVLGIAGFLFLRFQNQRPQVDKLSSTQVKSVVSKLIERGDYKEALSLMQARQGDPGFNAQMGIYYSLLSLQEQGQSLTARRVLEELLETQPDMKVRTLTGLGLSYMVDKNYSEGAEFFKMALSLDPQFVPAKVDEFMARSLQNLPINAQDLTQPWFKQQPEALITATLQLVRQNSTQDYIQILRNLEVYANQNFNFQLEAQFLAQYLKWKINPQSKDFSGWENLVDSDPEMTNLHRQNVFVYRHHLGWEVLFPLCKEMVSSHALAVEAQMLNVFCHFKAKKFKDARTQAEAAVDKNPKNGLIQAWFALALKESGSPDQASVALGRALEANRKLTHRLPLLLQGRFCEETQNLNCAYESWKKLLEFDYNNLAALAGLAKVNQIQKSQEEGEKFLKRGLSLSADYKPFLTVRDEWRNQL